MADVEGMCARIRLGHGNFGRQDVVADMVAD